MQFSFIPKGYIFSFFISKHTQQTRTYSEFPLRVSLFENYACLAFMKKEKKKTTTKKSRFLLLLMFSRDESLWNFFSLPCIYELRVNRVERKKTTRAVRRRLHKAFFNAFFSSLHFAFLL